jgi:ribokinase
MITRLGRDTFADLAFATWKDAGVIPAVTQHDAATGAAYIFIEEATGNNAIIICPGVAAGISSEDIDAKADLIGSASVFITQLEQPIEAAMRGLQVARAGGAITILNPAPAAELPPEIYPLCDVMTPNESEAEGITGIKVTDLASAEEAARAMMAMGVGTGIITLGENGVLLVDAEGAHHQPVISAGPVVETTGAGDAFNGGFAVGLSEGMNMRDAVRFGCSTAGISVTRPGTAPSMPARAEIDALLASL